MFWLANPVHRRIVRAVEQLSLPDVSTPPALGGQLLKWIGSKYRVADEIVRHFPTRYGRFIEPFLGSGAILATLAPQHGIGGDRFRPLVEIWQTLVSDPAELKRWYADRWARIAELGKREAYAECLANYNRQPNGADFVFLCRACYGGVVRFRKADGYMSTPCGIHDAIRPAAFNSRVDAWHLRVRQCEFIEADYRELMARATAGDLVYCDPPYVHSQTILYGAQAFDLAELMDEIAACKQRGVRVALSIDGFKKSGAAHCPIEIPARLFEQEILINCGRSMLRRFQLEGRDAEDEVVADRLLLTY